MLLKEEFDAKNVELNRNANGSVFLTTEPFVGNIDEHSIQKLFSAGAVVSEEELDELVLNLTSTHKIMTPPYQLPMAPSKPSYFNFFPKISNQTNNNDEERKEDQYQTVHKFDQSNAKIYTSFPSSSPPPPTRHNYDFNRDSIRSNRPISIHGKNRGKNKTTTNQTNVANNSFGASPKYTFKSNHHRPNQAKPSLTTMTTSTTTTTTTTLAPIELDTNRMPVNTVIETNFQDSDLNSVESQIFNTTATTSNSIIESTIIKKENNLVANSTSHIGNITPNRLTTEKLAYILISSCCGFAVLCLLVVFVTVRCRDMYQDYKAWKRAQKLAFSWPPRHLGLRPIRRSFPYQFTESFLMRRPFNLPRYFRTSIREDRERPSIDGLIDESPGTIGPPMFNMCQPMPVLKNYNPGNKTDKILNTILRNTKLPELNPSNSCCHCMNCTSTWFYRNNKNGGWCCQRGYYQPPRRSKLPFGAGSSVNTFMPQGRSMSNNNLGNGFNKECTDNTFDFLNDHDLSIDISDENDRQQIQTNRKVLMNQTTENDMNELEDLSDNCIHHKYFHYNDFMNNESAGCSSETHPQHRRWPQAANGMHATGNIFAGHKGNSKHARGK